MSKNIERDLASAIHWSLMRQREPITSGEGGEGGFVEMQALTCPYYVPLSGEWGSDWGAIMHPRSTKFGQLVFEHEWCGCTNHPEEEKP